MPRTNWILPVTLTALRSEEIQQGEEELLTTERLNVAGYEIGISLANCRCKGTGEASEPNARFSLERLPQRCRWVAASFTAIFP